MIPSFFRMTDLERLAVQVAIAAPEQLQNGSAYLPADTIKALRTELERRNFDWRDARKRLLELRERDRRPVAQRAAR